MGGERAMSNIGSRRAQQVALIVAKAARVGDVVALAEQMEEVSNMVSTAHICYVGKDAPSLEQCSDKQ